MKNEIFGQMTKWLLVVLLACIFGVTKASSDEKALLDHILKDLDTAVRPVKHPKDVVHVTMSMKLNHIMELKWNAPAMSWVPSAHGNVTSLHIPSERIWIPDLVLRTNLMNVDEKTMADTWVVIQHDGKATWSGPTITMTHCPMSSRYFPFDKHECPMDFTLWTYPADQATLVPDETENTTTSGEDNLWAWNVTSHHVTEAILPLDEGHVHSQVTFLLTFERKPLFYIYSVVYPGVVIMGISVLSFFLPNRGGERMVFGLSILVAMTFYQQNIPEISLPTNDGIPLLSQLFGTGVLMTAVTVGCAVVALRVHFKGAREPMNLPNPTLIKYIGRLTCLHRQVEEILNSEPELLNAKFTGEPEFGGSFNHLLQTNISFQNPTDLRGANGPNSINYVRDIASEIRDIRRVFSSYNRKRKDIRRTTAIWELIARMFQRVAIVVCVLALVGACTGIFLHLTSRT